MSDTLSVSAPAGTFTGTRGEDGSALFAGIPFAAPPTGGLRFRPPRPLPDAREPVDATRFAPAPPQGGTALALRMSPAAGGGAGGAGAGAAAGAAGMFAAASPETSKAMAALMAAAAGQGQLETSEDCLYLNVWTPDAAASLPVIVWMYGGGFDVGSASPPFTDGAALARLANVVVVSVNYRVGALGFGYWVGVAGKDCAESSNLGLQDQAAGLRWVRRNIAAFGGDPANVTVAGESAGAFCIGTLLTMPLARGLFDRAILQSGSTRRVFPTGTADRVAHDLLDVLGVRTMEELQEVDADAIVRAQGSVVDGDIGARNLPGGRSWGVVHDGLIVPRDPHEALSDGEARTIPVLTGANHDEVLIFRRLLGDAFAAGGEAALEAEMSRALVPDPRALTQAYRARAERAGTPADVGDIRAAFLGDVIYRRPSIETAAAQAAAGGQAWAYLFSAAPLGPAVGAFHGADLSYAFDHLSQAGLDTPGNLAVRDAFIGAWRDFAYSGDPGWSAYNAKEPGEVREFGGPAEFVAEPPQDEVAAAWPPQP
jgi:para-nitrobenzyl esterase